MELPTDFPEEMQFLLHCIKEYLVEKIFAANNSAIRNNTEEWRIKLIFWEFIIDVARKLINNKCQKTSFNAEILSLCIPMVHVRFLVPLHFPPSSRPLDQFDLQFRRAIISARMDAKELEKLLITPYKFAHTVVSQKYDAVGNIVMSGDVGLLKLLLRFGAVPLKRLDVPINLQEYKQLNMAVNTLHHNFGFNNQSPRADHLTDTLQHIDEHQRRRMVLVARVLQVLGKIWHRPVDAHIYVATIKLLFKSIPDPFVTSREIEEKIETVLAGNIPHSKVSALCKRYEEFFPEASKLPSPRSLKHLSRCEIRDSMKVAEALPTGVDSLALPNKLKEYILLKEDRHLERNPIMATECYVHYRMPAGTAGRVLCYVPKDY